jgi:hypothetical protein
MKHDTFVDKTEVICNECLFSLVEKNLPLHKYFLESNQSRQLLFFKSHTTIHSHAHKVTTILSNLYHLKRQNYLYKH